MGFFDRLKQKRIARKLVADVRSSDWGVAEDAIARVPDVLDTDTALSLLVPLSRGAGSRLVNPLRELPPTPTYQFSAGVHLGSAIKALGRVADPRATAALLAVLTELPNFVPHAIDALGAPAHAAAVGELERRYPRVDRSFGQRLRNAFWHMGSDEALEACLRIDKAHGSPFSEETIRRAWAQRQEELRNPKPPVRSVRPLPLPG
jgi:hypothetical protein